jgi:hypothetical protein
MKKTFIFLIVAMLFCNNLWAQSPNSFNYQALLRDSDGQPIADEVVQVEVSIRKDVTNGEIVYTESFSKLTDQFGLVKLKIGTGTTNDDFTLIDWTTGWYYLELKLNGTVLGTTLLMAVPYAKYADKAGNVFSGDYKDLINKPDFSDYLPDFSDWDQNESDDFSGDYNDLVNTPTLPEPTDTSRFISISNPKEGDIAYFNGEKWEVLAKGEEDEVLMIESGIPSWKYIVLDENVKNVGDFYLGGIIYYLSPDKQHGLVAGLNDLDAGDGVGWSNISNIEAGSSSFYNGAANTDSILLNIAGNSAAQLCRDLGEDWYLPSAWELHLLHIAAYEINKTLENDSDPNTVGIKITSSEAGGRYWSSTELSNNRAWSFMFDYGYSANSNKSTPCRVRAVRSF